MKKKELEIFLEKIPDFSYPKSYLEQYKTPAAIASDILFLAYGFHDILGKKILDLGCGTGIFSVGAKLLQAKKVIGVDLDPECIKQAKEFSEKHHIDVEFLNMDIAMISEKVDTVLMNPPFGAQKKNIHADRVFIEKATKLATVVYSLHPTNTVDFITKILTALEKKSLVLKTYEFLIQAQFPFHTKLKDTVTVSLLQIK